MGVELADGQKGASTALTGASLDDGTALALKAPTGTGLKGRCLAAEAERFSLCGTFLPAGRLHPQCLYCSTVPQSETIATLALALVAARVGSGFDLGCHRHPEPLLHA